MVIWLIGMSGAGKTAIGKEVFAQLKQRRPNVVFLDGDAVREIMGSDLGHSLEARRANAGRISRLCKYLDDQGIDVVCSILSIFHESQAWNRSQIARYFEVYIRVPFEVLEARDSKGLYRAAREGKATNVVGVDIPFPPPLNPDLIIDNGDVVDSFDGLAARVLAAIPWESK